MCRLTKSFNSYGTPIIASYGRRATVMNRYVANQTWDRHGTARHESNRFTSFLLFFIWLIHLSLSTVPFVDLSFITIDGNYVIYLEATVDECVHTCSWLSNIDVLLFRTIFFYVWFFMYTNIRAKCDLKTSFIRQIGASVVSRRSLD